eukprot:10780906-Lingulodinium_polyedra.AAC.1
MGTKRDVKWEAGEATTPLPPCLRFAVCSPCLEVPRGCMGLAVRVAPRREGHLIEIAVPRCERASAEYGVSAARPAVHCSIDDVASAPAVP